MAEPQGISLPVRRTVRGGFALAKGDAYIREIVLRAVSPNYSDNPFEVLYMEEDTVFANQSPALRAKVSDSLHRVFAYLEGRGIARLADSGGISFEKGDSDGELKLVVEYLNLKTQDPGVVTRTLRPRAAGV